MSSAENVIAAIEARYPGHKVVQMTGIRGMSPQDASNLVVAIVNAGPPITRPEQLVAKVGSDE